MIGTMRRLRDLHSSYARALVWLVSIAACNAHTQVPHGESGTASESTVFDPTQGSTEGASDGTSTGAGDDGEPREPTTDPQSCDAGHESFVKRVIPLVQGRKPESIREVRLLVQIIQSIDETGGNGRFELAYGLAAGPLYLERWKMFFLDQLRVNRIESKLNLGCYATNTAAGNSPEFAALIRDNDAEAVVFVPPFTMSDVIESALRLDDITPAYRADLFARMARAMLGANVSDRDLELARRASYGEAFEAAYLGRNTGCLECHNSEYSVTQHEDPTLSRFFPLAGLFEKAIYGASEGRPPQDLHAAFRRVGVFGGDIRPWGMSIACGLFSNTRSGDLLRDEDYVPYLAGPLPDGANVFDVDPKYRSGLAELRSSGLVIGADGSVDPDMALAYLLVVNVTNNVWKEAFGTPLTIAHYFPRNRAQHDILGSLANAFIDAGYSHRTLLANIATHPYFNQRPPAECGTSTPYFMDAVFDAFTNTAADPNTRGNGVGDTIHRYGAWVLIDSAMRSLWWDRATQFPAEDRPEAELANMAFLRDQGIFLKDAQPGFNGVDLVGMLRWENELGSGRDPSLGGKCTGPSTVIDCSTIVGDFVDALVDAATSIPGITMMDVVVALKDRLITEPMVSEDEVAVIERVIGTTLTDLATDPEAVEAAARKYVGVLLNTPQFMLAGLPSADQDPAADPVLEVEGTSTTSLCNMLASAVLDKDKWTWTCRGDGITLSPT